MSERALSNGADASRPYLVVSVDGHVGPSMERQLRPYCPKRYLDDFDSYVRTMRQVAAGVDATEAAKVAGGNVTFEPRGPEVTKALRWAARKEDIAEGARSPARSWFCEGQQDPHVRHRDMDADGVAAEVIFAGGQNGELLPFLTWGFEQGQASISWELRAVGSHIYNKWLADFISVAPERHVGAMQITIGDVDAAVRELEWGRAAGLTAVNLPAPQSNSAPYTDAVYEPFWAACEDLQLTFVTHTGGGDKAHGHDGFMGMPLMQMENRFMSRRGLWQMIFAGVFERHPGLKLMFVENGVTWAEDTLRDMDSLYFSDGHSYVRDVLKRKPSEYWADNCFVGASFLARYEVAARHTVGVRNLAWGSDYPHVEGTWPNTMQAMRNTFWDVPEEETRLILGENAVRVFNLDLQKLRPLADRIGPTPDQLRKPLAPDEFPASRGHSFREYGVVA